LKSDLTSSSETGELSAKKATSPDTIGTHNASLANMKCYALRLLSNAKNPDLQPDFEVISPKATVGLWTLVRRIRQEH